MIVGESAPAQGLIHAEHVGLVAVVGGILGALHEHGVLVGHRGIDEVLAGASAGLLIEVFAGLLLIVEVEPGGIGVGGASACASKVLAVLDLVVHNPPMYVGGGSGSGVGVAIETDFARGSYEVEQIAALHGREIDFHRGGVPGRTAHDGRVGAGSDGDDGLVESLIRLWGIIGPMGQIIGGKGGKHEGIIELALGEGGQ